MAKRFTDTTIWDRPWFRKLSPKMKEAWRFLCEKSDHAGIWEIDFETMSYFVGDKVTREDVIFHFGEMIRFHGSQILVVGFVEFQYGELKDTNNAHRSVIQRLKSLAPAEGLTSPLPGDQDKDKDKEMEKEEKKTFLNDAAKMENRFKFDYALIFDTYPRHEQRTAAMSWMQSNIHTSEHFDILSTAVKNYRKQCEQDKTERRFIKLFLTFTKEWQEWAVIGNGASAIEPKAIKYPDFVPEPEPKRGLDPNQLAKMMADGGLNLHGMKKL